MVKNAQLLMFADITHGLWYLKNQSDYEFHRSQENLRKITIFH